MKRIFALVLSVALLGGCANPMYDGKNYTRQEWSNKSFDHSMMQCRHSSMRLRETLFSYRINDTLYKACMEKNGYYYDEQSLFALDRQRPVNTDQVTGYGAKRDIAELPKTNPQTEQDKSALYK